MVAIRGERHRMHSMLLIALYQTLSFTINSIIESAPRCVVRARVCATHPFY